MPVAMCNMEHNLWYDIQESVCPDNKNLK